MFSRWAPENHTVHIEAGGNSIGFFIEHEDDLVLAGEALFACARAVANDDFSEAICEPDGSSVSGVLHHARPLENPDQTAEPLGAWRFFGILPDRIRTREGCKFRLIHQRVSGDDGFGS